MSFHAPISPEAARALAAQNRRSTLSSLLCAILFLILVGLVLALILIKPITFDTTPIVSYQGSFTPEEPVIKPKTITNRAKPVPSSSASSAAKVIAANSASPTSVPVPELNALPTIEFGDGDDFDTGWGNGSSGNGGGAGSFGSIGGLGLSGTFYDLKQTSNRQNTEMRIQDFEIGGELRIHAPVNQLYDEVVADVVRQDLRSQAFSNYFHSPNRLILSQLYIPRIKAEEAPKSFQVGDSVQGRRWLIAYRGKVVVPESGRYRFVGYADDVLVVLVNNQMVLDASLISTLPGSDRRESVPYPGSWKHYKGKWFTARNSQTIDLKILTGERPGGEYSSCLLIEKEGETFEKNESGSDLLPLFKTKPSPMPSRGARLPEIAPDTSWSIWQAR